MPSRVVNFSRLRYISQINLRYTKQPAGVAPKMYPVLDDGDEEDDWDEEDWEDF